MPKSELRIDILGTSLSISTDEEPEYLDLLLDKYHSAVENVQRKTGLKDPLKTAILTGFLLCDELEKAGKVTVKNDEPIEAEQLTLGMISRLDEIVSTKNSNGIIKLQGSIKNYDWGSAEWLPVLLGQKNLSRVPWAELWLELNPSEPNYEKLPFLFKVLAAEKPLSIQVHPNLNEARDGFERENMKRIPIDAPNRNYKDPNEKKEIICALSPFVALCGFREQWEISSLMEILSILPAKNEEALKTCLDKLILALEGENPLKTFLNDFYCLDNEAIKTLTSSIKSQINLLKNDFPEYKNTWELCVYLSNLYPEDPLIFAPLFLNIIELEPGEAIYVPAGTIHSYVKGMGIELMTYSDNVLRGGLTVKHVDTEDILNNTDFSVHKPEIMPAPAAESLLHRYPAPIEDFSLSVINNRREPFSYPKTGPSIMLITEGTATVAESDIVLSKGESVFIPRGINLEFSGTFAAFVAAAPV